MWTTSPTRGSRSRTRRSPPARPAFTNATTASFAFDGNVTGPTTCQLDAQEPFTCRIGQDVSELLEGVHTFTAFIRNGYGDTDPTPATYTWEVDLTPPSTSIDRTPPNPSRSA